MTVGATEGRTTIYHCAPRRTGPTLTALPSFVFGTDIRDEGRLPTTEDGAHSTWVVTLGLVSHPPSSPSCTGERRVDCVLGLQHSPGGLCRCVCFEASHILGRGRRERGGEFGRSVGQGRGHSFLHSRYGHPGPDRTTVVPLVL